MLGQGRQSAESSYDCKKRVWRRMKMVDASTSIIGAWIERRSGEMCAAPACSTGSMRACRLQRG